MMTNGCRQISTRLNRMVFEKSSLMRKSSSSSSSKKSEKILFVTRGFRGEIDCFLSIAFEIRKRSQHQVWLCSPELYSDILALQFVEYEGINIPFCGLNGRSENEELRSRTTRSLLEEGSRALTKATQHLTTVTQVGT
jgi:hypothetical protein